MQQSASDFPKNISQSFASYAIGRLILADMARQGLSRTDLARRIGKNVPKILRRLDQLLRSGNEPIILPRLVDALGIDPEALKVALRETEAELRAERDEAERRREQYERDHFVPHVVVETDPARMPTRNLSTAIIYSVSKRIELPAELRTLLLWDQADAVAEIVKRHFIKHQGVLDDFGRIIGYSFRRTYDDSIRFSTSGKVTNWFGTRPPEAQWMAIERRSDSIPAIVDQRG